MSKRGKRVFTVTITDAERGLSLLELDEVRFALSGLHVLDVRPNTIIRLTKAKIKVVEKAL